jgi:hypothetical protein
MASKSSRVRAGQVCRHDRVDVRGKQQEVKAVRGRSSARGRDTILVFREGRASRFAADTLLKVFGRGRGRR